MNSAIYAGLMAWALEIAIAVMLLLVVRHEERKVVRRRAKKEKI